MKVISWIIGILGLWVISSALLVFTPEFIQWSYVISGAVISFLGFIFFEEKREYGWIAGFTGMWIFISAFIPELLSGSELALNGIIAGTIAALDGFFSIKVKKSGKKMKPAV